MRRRTCRSFAAGSHDRSVPSRENTSRRRPSGLNARLADGVPAREARRPPGRLPRPRLNRAVGLPRGDRLPSGRKATACRRCRPATLPAGSTRRASSSRLVKCQPFPVAVLRGGGLQGAAGGAAVLELQGAGRGRDVRPVALPALGVASAAGLVRGLLGRRGTAPPLSGGSLARAACLVQTQSVEVPAASNDATVARTSTAVSTPPSTAMPGLCRAQRT